MSFIITLCVPEGLVMASDSRSTTSVEIRRANKVALETYVQTDSMYKTFLAPGRIGISTCGAADVQHVPLSFHIESFIRGHLADNDHQVDQVAKEILKYFCALPGPPGAGFLVAGYKPTKNGPRPHVWEVSIKPERTKWLNKDCIYGCIPRGEIHTFQRLTRQAKVCQNNSQKFKLLSSREVDLDMFTLQDVVDYAMYATKVTIDIMCFQRRYKTVGGPIDVLVIKSDEAFWVQRKELHA